MYNCVIIEDDELAREGLVKFIAQIPYLNLIGSYESPLGLLSHSERIDLVFSDIHMPEMDGISYLKSLSNPPLFIFVSGNPEYAAESYNLDVVDFVQKPFDFSRVMKAANKAKAVLETRQGVKNNAEYLVIKDRNLHTILEYSTMCYVKADKDYVKIETTEKPVTLWRSLANVLNALPKDRFLQVHKSYIVNAEFVRSIGAQKIIMKGDLDDVPLGETFKNEVRRYFGID